MKIANKQIHTFIKKLPADIKIILLHGYDSGLIQELSNNIKTTFLGNNYSPYSITEINALSLNTEDQTLQEAIYNESLFGDSKKLVVVYNCSSSIISKIKEIINDINTDTLLLLLANELATNNTLRTFIEKNNNTASIACYHDNNLSLKNYIVDYLKDNNFSIDPNALNWLINNLGNDRLITYQELNKLIIYKGEDKNITFSDVSNVVSDNNDLAITDLILDIFSGKHLNAYNNISQYLLNYPALILLRGMINFLKRLIFAKTLELQDLPFNTILSKIQPPVLFLHVEKFKLIFSKWNIKQINYYLKQCIILELNIKKHPSLTQVLLNKFALDIFLLFNRTKS